MHTEVREKIMGASKIKQPTVFWGVLLLEIYEERHYFCVWSHKFPGILKNVM